MCEISLACDNLLCDGHGRPPNPVLEVDVQTSRSKTWIKYARSEVVEVNIVNEMNEIVYREMYLTNIYVLQRSSNPGFLVTVSFRASDDVMADSRIRITAYDVRERVSQTATPIGSAILVFSTVQDTPR